MSGKAGAFHYQLPISAARTIDSRDKQRALIVALTELYEHSQNAVDASVKFESAKENLATFFNDLHWRIVEFETELKRKIDEKREAITAAVSVASERIITNLSTADQELVALSAYLTNSFSALADIENFLEGCSTDKVMSAVESSVNISFAKHSQGTQLDIVLCLPSNQSLGVFSFSSQAQVTEVKDTIEEMKGFPRFNLFFGDMLLRSDESLATYKLPKLAVIAVYPIVTVRSDEGSNDIYIKDTETVKHLKSKLTYRGESLREYHRLVCDDKVLDDDFLLINAGKSSVFDLIISERPMEVLLVRDENYHIYEIPFDQNEETIRSLKNRIAQAIRYDEDSQRLSYRFQILNDTESLSTAGVQGGSVLDLERLTRVYVLIPVIRIPFCLTQPNNSATVLSAKLEIAHLLQLPPDHQVISYQGRVMGDEEPLSSDYKSSINVTLEMKEYLLATFKTNEYVAIEYLGGDETVYELKNRLAETMNLVVQLLELTYNSKKLSDAVSLASAGVGEGCLVSLFQRDLADSRVSNSDCFGNTTQGADDLSKNSSDLLGKFLKLKDTLRVTIKCSGHDDLVMERLERRTRIVTLKESIRVSFGVPVAEQELFHGNRRAEDSMLLENFTAVNLAEGLVFRLHAEEDDLYS
jgi:hypothetical protein